MPKQSVTPENVKSFNAQNNIEGFNEYDFRGDSTLVVFYKSADATIHLENGKAEINFWRQRPVFAQLWSLHSSFGDDNWYKWYSDIFASGLIFIAVLGMFLMRGKYSFRKRGWLFALEGIIILIIALFLFA